MDHSNTSNFNEKNREFISPNFYIWHILKTIDQAAPPIPSVAGASYSSKANLRAVSRRRQGVGTWEGAADDSSTCGGGITQIRGEGTTFFSLPRNTFDPKASDIVPNTSKGFVH